MRHALHLSLILLLAATRVFGQTDVPEVARTLFDEAERHRTAGRDEEAIRAYEEVLRLAPTVVPAYVALGALYTTQGKLERALETFDAGLEHGPEDPVLLFNAAVVAQRLERFEPALVYCRRALALSRKDAQLLELEASILRRLDRPREALESLEAARKQASGDARILFALGNLYHELGRPNEAIDAYRKAIKRDKQMLRAHYNLGAVLFEVERYDEAQQAYELAMAPIDEAFARGEEVPEEHARAYANLGAIYYRKGDWKRAVAAYDKSLALDPDQAVAHYNLGFIHFQEGRHDAAIQAYRKALEIDPSLPLAYLHLGQIYRAAGDLTAAVEIVEQGMPRFDDTAAKTARLLAAESYLGLGRDPEAEQAFRAALAADPDEVAALAGLGSLLRRLGRLDEAQPLLERARQAAPRDAGLALELAAIARAANDLEGEAELYRSVLASYRGPTDLWPLEMNLAVHALRSGEIEEAKKRLEEIMPRLGKLLETGQLSGEAVRQITTLYALLLARDGNLESARQQLGSGAAASFSPARQAVAALDAIGSQYETAARELGHLVDEGAASVSAGLGRELRGQLGLVLWWGNHSREARGHLAAAAQAFPDWLEVRAALGEVYLAGGSWAPAITQLDAASDLCRRPEPAAGGSAETPREHLRVDLLASPRGREELCARLQPHLGMALVRAGLEDLARPGQSGRALAHAARAVALPLDPAHLATARFLIGTGALLAGDTARAQGELEAALAGPLPPELTGVAENNLGVALHRQGEAAAARRHLDSAERAENAPVASTLNLGILLDESQANRDALAYYERYVAAGGARSGEVSDWVERLRRLVP